MCVPVYLSLFSLCLSSPSHFSSLSCLFDTNPILLQPQRQDEERRGLSRAQGPCKDLSDRPTRKICARIERGMIYRPYF